MRRFLLSCLLFLVVLVIILALCVCFMPHNKYHYLHAYPGKMERVDTMSSPRVIFVGGSNLAFGLDSEVLTDSTGYNVANTGLQAGIGLRFMLNDIEKRVHKNDLVIIVPEYSQFYDLYDGIWEVLPFVVIYSCKETWDLLTASQKIKVLAGLPSYVAENLNAQQTEGWPISGISFNKFGDETGHWGMKDVRLEQKFIKVENKFNHEAADNLAVMIKNIEEKGANVYLWWPITIESNFRENSKVIEEIENELSKRDIHFSVSPEAFVYPDSLAFNTPYHLNYEGVKKNTSRFVKELRNIPK